MLLMTLVELLSEGSQWAMQLSPLHGGILGFSALQRTRIHAVFFEPLLQDGICTPATRWAEAVWQQMGAFPKGRDNKLQTLQQVLERGGLRWTVNLGSGSLACHAIQARPYNVPAGSAGSKQWLPRLLCSCVCPVNGRPLCTHCGSSGSRPTCSKVCSLVSDDW